MLHAVTGFALVAAVLTIIPGLDTTLVLRTAIARGRDQAAVTAVGVCAGLLVWGVAAAVGAAALLAASELAWFTLIITGAYAAKRWLSRPRATRIIDRVAGVVIIGFAGRLALQPR